MRTRSISIATAVAVLFGSAALSLGTAATASAAPAARVTTPGGLAVDGVVKRVFVGDSANGTVVAADYSGAVLGSIKGVTGVSDLAVSDDGATVYAAAPEIHEIWAIDASTLGLKARYTVPTTTGPRHVAFSGGKVWFSYGDQWDGNIGSVDPTVDPASGTDPVTMEQIPAEGTSVGIWGQALLDTDPTQPGILAVGETGLSTASMAVLDVSGGKPALVAWHNGDYSLNSGIGDIDLVPGGKQVLVNGKDRDAYADGAFKAMAPTPTASSPTSPPTASSPRSTAPRSSRTSPTRPCRCTRTTRARPRPPTSPGRRTTPGSSRSSARTAATASRCSPARR